MSLDSGAPTFHSTTVLAVRRNGKGAIGADGQVTLGNTVMKQSARKVRRIHHGKVLVGFAGASADAFALLERFESKLESHRGELVRSAVELAKDWRTDRFLRKLEAMLIAMDGESLLLVSGNGDVIEPDEDVVAIGSGGPYALSAARALLRHSELDAKDIVAASMRIAGETCIYTNSHLTLEEI